jgi:hypothetical protein
MSFSVIRFQIVGADELLHVLEQRVLSSGCAAAGAHHVRFLDHPSAKPHGSHHEVVAASVEDARPLSMQEPRTRDDRRVSVLARVSVLTRVSVLARVGLQGAGVRGIGQRRAGVLARIFDGGCIRGGRRAGVLARVAGSRVRGGRLYRVLASIFYDSRSGVGGSAPLGRIVLTGGAQSRSQRPRQQGSVTWLHATSPWLSDLTRGSSSGWARLLRVVLPATDPGESSAPLSQRWAIQAIVGQSSDAATLGPQHTAASAPRKAR